MKKHLILVSLLIASSVALAQDVKIGGKVYGSGQPGNLGLENATIVSNDAFHAPQYMPFYPTAATIWPRVVEVPCVNAGGDLVCEGYNWAPALGRGEYLFFLPKIVNEPPVQEVYIPVPIPSKPIYVEVEKKKKRQ